ncbi:MAG TPA: carboxy terminal-processing peptidase [Clostridia bacterium]|nr:carboxy terminal-processing peptidase [Clostridia bacterium]
MLERFTFKLLPVLLCGFALCTADALEAQTANPAPDSAGKISVGTNVFTLVSPGPADGRIAFITAKMLEQLQYQRQPFSDAVASRFLDRYLETLDPQHLHFLQSDLREFESYRTNLDNLTTPRSQVADTRPASHIFNRFVQRLGQRVAFIDQQLSKEQFTFDSDQRITINRRELPYPKDLAEAQQLWGERLRFEYLQERLGKLEAKKKAEKEPRVLDTNNVAQAEKKIEANPKSEHEQIVETLSHRYHRNLRTFTDWDNDDVLQIYLTALSHVFDPHSDYLGQEMLDSFAIGMNLSLFGIGAELTSEDGYCTIRRLLPGGPAEKSKKLKEKDKIIQVAQSNQPPVDVVDMSLNKAVQLIRGPKGTEVKLTVIPAGADSAERVVLTLIRDEIKLEDQAAKAKLIELPSSDTGGSMRLGVIDLPSFYASFDLNSRGKSQPRSTVADVAKLLTKLKKEKVDGIILDLRRNGGGSLEEAIRLTGLFIKEGPVVQVRDFSGTVEEDSDEDPTILYGGPLVVLTSRFSASASEILAGALQDYGRALVVGDSSTHGKGTVQSVNDLKPWMKHENTVWTNAPGALKVTIKKFYRASGASTQVKGVVPDIVLPSIISESKDIGESALDNPMPWDTIPGSKYERLNLVAPYLAELRKRSSQRINQDQDFAYVREDIVQFNKLQADKTISLNEEERIKEKEDAEARQKARDKERRARPERKQTVYEITLKDVDLPGLPAPMQKTNALAAIKVDGVPTTTNMSAAHTPSASVDPLEDALDEDKAPSIDPVMAEAERILVDYLGVLSKANVVATGK